MTYILIALFSFWLVDITKVPRDLSEWLKRKGILYNVYEDHLVKERYAKRLKPFDCAMCLSFWLALGYALATDPASWYCAFLTSLGTVTFALTFNKLLR